MEGRNRLTVCQQMQLGEKKKAFKDLRNLKSKINDVPILEEENMEVKFNKDRLRREGFQRPFSVARQLPREMSESGHGEGGWQPREGQQRPLRASVLPRQTQPCLLREPGQLGGRAGRPVGRPPWDTTTVLFQGLLELRF